MARRRRALNRFNETHLEMCKHMRVSGAMTRPEIESYIGRNALRHMQEDGLLKRKEQVNGKGETLIGFSFTDKGLKSAKRDLELDSFYRGNKLAHDLKMSSKISELSDSERYTLKTESELRKEFKSHVDELKEGNLVRALELSERYSNREISIPDFSYTTELQEVIHYEVVTRNYRDSDIQAKYEYVEAMGGSLMIEKA